MAIITIKEGILTFAGINPDTADTTILDIVSTNNVARPMPNPFIAEVVVPSVGHIPRTRTNVGFSLIIPLVIKLSLLIWDLLFFSICCTYLIYFVRLTHSITKSS